MALLTPTCPLGMAWAGRFGTGPDALVVYRTRGRLVSRRRVTPHDPKSPLQQLLRSLRSSLARRYVGLGRDGMDSWNRFGKQFHQSPLTGASEGYQGSQAYQAVNVHRVLAGREVLDVPPEFISVPAPQGVSRAEALADGRLRLLVEHGIAPGAGYWRVRLTPPLSSRARLAAPSQLRLAALEPAAAYVPIATSPQAVVLFPRFPYAPGATLGVEILALSEAFVPGKSLFVRWVRVEAG